MTNLRDALAFLILAAAVAASLYLFAMGSFVLHEASRIALGSAGLALCGPLAFAMALRASGVGR